VLPEWLGQTCIAKEIQKAITDNPKDQVTAELVNRNQPFVGHFCLQNNLCCWKHM